MISEEKKMIDLNQLHYGIKMDDDEAYEQLEELVSLRKPKRVVHKGVESFIGIHCPKCDNPCYNMRWNYCPYCGQALDWNQAKENV